MIAFINVAAGQVYKPYINKTRNEEDFVRAIDDIVQTNPSASWTFVLDGLNTHKSAFLVEYAAKECGLPVNLGIKRKVGILKSLNSRTIFLTNPTHRICFVYTPKHCSWVNRTEIWFSILSRRLLRRSTYDSVEDLVNSILRFVNQYNKSARLFSIS